MVIYLINDVEVSKDEFNSQLEDAVNEYCEDTYDELLDDSNEEVHIGSLTYSPSIVLSRCDAVAYRCGLSDYQSSELGDAQSQLDQCGAVDVLDKTFVIEEIEEE